MKLIISGESKVYGHQKLAGYVEIAVYLLDLICAALSKQFQRPGYVAQCLPESLQTCSLY